MLGKLNLANLYKYFFFLFVFSIPLQTRKVFLTDYSFYTGTFTEFGSFYLYLSDVLFIFALSSLCLFNYKIVKDGFTKLKDKNANPQRRNILLALIFLSLCFLLSSSVHHQYAGLSLFRCIKITEMLFLVLFVYITFSDKRFFTNSLFFIALAGFFQGIIAIYQFLYQHSLFISPLWHKLLGETILSPRLPGIAKITSDGTSIIRAYGTLPHPNILGGFLIFSIFVSLYLYLCHYEHYLSSFFKSKITRFKQLFISMFWLVLFTFQFLGLFLSFSRSAWLSFLASILMFLVFYLKYVRIVSRETILSFVFVKYRELSISLLIIIVIIIGNTNLTFNRVQQNLNQTPNEYSDLLPQNDTLNDRRFFNNVSRETIIQNPLLGSGPGTSIFQINRYLLQQDRPTKLEGWQYQPSHNIFFLSASEIGILGFLLFLYILSQTVSLGTKIIVSRETMPNKIILKLAFLSILFSFIVIGQFDHYLWTLQQGQLIFWFTIGALLI